MRKFGLIGFPLGHSFSKQYFTDKFLEESISDCSYENYQLENLELIQDMILSDSDVCGLNITIPYKSEILKYVDIADEVALEAGAINVLKISRTHKDRIIKGFNTDVYGFRESLVPHLSGINIKSAIILGTGGSSKAVAYVLNKLGISIIHVSRQHAHGKIRYNELSDKMLLENKLIINTTPLGMYPKVEDKPDINYKKLTSDHILYDLIYNPDVTAFLKEGKERGCKIIGGLNMLRLQAEKSWEIWNDEKI
jgi:shikimate dehydrogenase